MRELRNVEEKILDRALYLIGKNHSCSISVRAIAKEAGVNVSAINYYFRSKEEMLRQAKELYITNTLSITEILNRTEYGNEEKLVFSANEIMEYNIRFPGITFLLKDARENGDDISKKVLEVSREMTDGINLILDDFIGSKGRDIQYKRMIFWASINYPIEVNGLSQFDSEILEVKETRLTYINNLLHMLKMKLD